MSDATYNGGYKPRDHVHAVLSQIYCEAGVPASQPEKREKVLVRQLGLTDADNAVLQHLERTHGRAAAIYVLEDVAIANHQAQQERLARRRS
jgi:hypothetical protein